MKNECMIWENISDTCSSTTDEARTCSHLNQDPKFQWPHTTFSSSRNTVSLSVLHPLQIWAIFKCSHEHAKCQPLGILRGMAVFMSAADVPLSTLHSNLPYSTMWTSLAPILDTVVLQPLHVNISNLKSLNNMYADTPVSFLYCKEFNKTLSKTLMLGYNSFRNTAINKDHRVSYLVSQV